MTVHNANILYVINATANRTSAQELAAYLDDRRGKGYSVTDGLGPLASIWRAAAQQTTTITGIPADATSVLYNDGGNNTGVGSAGGNATFGGVVDFINNVGENGSTEPAKRFNASAHSQGVATDRFANYETNKANYLRYMTHGFSQTGDETKTAVVPKGAEVLLETRLPYLDADRRRVVLKTTVIASGYPILEDAEGWDRLNLFAAADGYGAFNGA